MKNKVRPFYEELMGYLSQAPSLKESSFLRDESLAPQLHSCIDQLNQITGQDFSRFKVTVHPDGDDSYVQNTEYRSKINGLIMNLHAQFFNDEPTPFSGSPSTVVHQNQSQSQTAQAQIIMLLEFQNLIHDKLNTTKDEKEKGFLENIKSKLAGIKNVVELIQLLVSTAKAFGLTIDQLLHIFS
ncbi:MAG: hypothetical protein ABIJ05_02860 [Patescibacteria group bacterium]